MRKSSQRVTFAVIAPLILLALALSACGILDPFVASSSHSSLSGGTAVPWPTFTDRGNDGFTISYPPTWKAMVSGLNDGLFIDTATQTSLEVRVTTVSQSPATALAQAQLTPAERAQRKTTVTQRTIAGHPAVDVFTPYYRVPTPVAHMPNSGVPGIAGGRVIVMAATNSAGTTNVYAFVVNYVLDASTNINPASLGDNEIIDAMLSTFQLPPTIGPVVTQP